MPMISHPDIKLLWQLQKSLKYPYARAKLARAILHLEERYYSEEHPPCGGRMMFVDGFDYYRSDEAIRLFWQNQKGETPPQ